MAYIKFQPPAYHYKTSDGLIHVAGWMPGDSIIMSPNDFYEWEKLGFPWMVFAYDRALAITDSSTLLMGRGRQEIPLELVNRLEFNC